MATSAPQLTRCKSCGAPIFYATTANGAPMPLDAVQVDNGTQFLVTSNGKLMTVHVNSKHELAAAARNENAPRYTSHFATCPHAKEHRRTHA